MPHRLPRAFAIAGLVILVCSLVILAYALWPLPGLREQFPLAPTLFAAP
jgi:hypothetical protein